MAKNSFVYQEKNLKPRRLELLFWRNKIRLADTKILSPIGLVNKRAHFITSFPAIKSGGFRLHQSQLASFKSPPASRPFHLAHGLMHHRVDAPG